MKKLFFVLTTSILGGGSLQAQQVHYSENFGSSLSMATYSFIPSNMIGINADGFPANTTNNPPFNLPGYLNLAAAVGYIDPMGSDTAAHMTSYLNPAGQADRWLITPPISGISANTLLSWESKAYNSFFPDGFEVWVSAAAGSNSNPTVSDFTALSSNMVFSIAAETDTFSKHLINLSAFAGQTIRVAFRNNSFNMRKLFIDDIKVFTPATNDIAMSIATPNGFNVWGAVNSNMTIGGTVRNNGYTPITSFTAKYDGGSVISQTFNNLNLAYGQSYSFSFSVPFNITTAVQTNMNVWAELNGDNVHSNDTITVNVNGYSNTPNHKVVIEENTGAWCSWCPIGTVYMDSIHSIHPNTTELIACHVFDIMTSSPYSDSMSYVQPGYPGIWADRYTSEYPDNIFNVYNAHINNFPFAGLNVTAYFNPVSRLVNVDVATSPATTIYSNNSDINDFRLAVVFTEMGVTGTTVDYDQANVFSYQSGNIPLSGAGHNWQMEPDPVLAANMQYDFVARQFLGGFRGLANSLPDTLLAGTTYHNTGFSYIVPAAYNANNMRAIALLFDTKNYVIYNANSAAFTVTSGIASDGHDESASFSVYPNPASSETNVQVELNTTESIRIDVYNATGQIVLSETKNNLPAGKNTITLNTQTLADGLYTVNVTSGRGSNAQKITVKH